MNLSGNSTLQTASFLILTTLITFATSCAEDEFFSSKGMQLVVNSNFMLADGQSEIIMTIVDQKNQEAPPGDVEFYANNELLGSNRFVTEVVGDFLLEARMKGSVSNQIIVTSRAKKDYAAVELPIIFHVIYDEDNAVGTGENFSAKDLYQIFDPLNDRFNNSSPVRGVDNPNKVVPQIFFRLAENDPQGNPLQEPGISRTPLPSLTSLISLDADWLKSIFWDPDRYINVWVGKSRGNFSLATGPTFPPSEVPLAGFRTNASQNPTEIDGIILSADAIRNQWVGTFSHEMGHYLGLFHVFDDRCDQEDSDFCPDTKFWLNEGNSIFPTFITRTSCDGQTYTSTNFMDYANGHLTTFTFDQVERMRYVLDKAKWRAQEEMRTL